MKIIKLMQWQHTPWVYGQKSLANVYCKVYYYDTELDEHCRKMYSASTFIDDYKNYERAVEAAKFVLQTELLNEHFYLPPICQLDKLMDDIHKETERGLKYANKSDQQEI